MEAPEKIYLQACGDCQDNECDNCKFEDLEYSGTWSTDRIFEKDIEYSQTDAFIEKACKYLEPIIYSMNLGDRPDTDKFIDDFKNYMKGE